MLAYRTATSEYGITSLWVKYPNHETLEIDLMEFYKDKNNIATLYDHVNLYVSQLNKETQEEIYSIFHENYLKEHTSSYSDRTVVKELELKVKRLCELLDYNRWKQWFRQFGPNILIPETVNENFTFDPDMGTTKEKTYIYQEYVDLVGLIVFIRALSPVYIEFFNYCNQVSSHPYYMLFRLFIESELQHCEEIEKLRSYISANQLTLVGTGKNEHLIIGAGLSDDDALDYLVGEVIFNKLLTIDFFYKKCNIVSFIFQTIKYKGSFVSSESMSIRPKSSKGDPNREDYSYFEDYRKTTSVPIGTETEIQDSLNDYAMLASELGYFDFDFVAFNNELQYINHLLKQPPENIQIYLLGWFLGKATNPRALFHLEPRKVAELRIFAKIALLPTKHSFIGVLLTSVKTPEVSYINILIRNTLNKNLLRNLKKHYSYAMEDDKVSIIEKTITELGKEIVNSIWSPVCDTSNIAGLITPENYLEIPSNINDVVCSFVDYILGNTQASPVE